MVSLGGGSAENAVVQRVAPGSQAARFHVLVGWTVAAIGGENVRTARDNKTTKYGRRIENRLRVASTYHLIYTVTFLGPAPPVDHEKVQEQEDALSNLDRLTSSQRDQNLDALEGLNTFEAGELLQRHRAVHGLLRGGIDELSVIFREMSAGQIRRCRSAWARLRAGEACRLGEMTEAEMRYEDGRGDTVVHMVASPDALADAISVVPAQMLTRANGSGEKPLECMLRRAGPSARLKLLGLMGKHSPGALRAPFADGAPLALSLDEEERRLLPSPPVSWQDVREVLLADDIESFRRGYAKASGLLLAACSDLEPGDHPAIWIGLLSEHCFGVLDSASPTSADGTTAQLRHTHASRERLKVVWHAIKLVLEACAGGISNLDSDVLDSETKQPVPHTDLKGISRGLLVATKGPGRPPFDPREPYRKDFVALVRELQSRSASRVKEVLQELQQAEPEAAGVVSREIPSSELHGLDTSRAEAREAPPRLRLDSGLAAEVEDVAPMSTPEWVLAHALTWRWSIF
ncbi:unnamed protein product [Prorocentrum cordatum]|uniref:Uncharacterized protein n=1 Tax=Prorocentrum cordatum TaxID=2364126 RepID=A0ABN9SWN9_9DINO|nr:unnamed protein product [Polarella glacialis]